MTKRRYKISIVFPLVWFLFMGTPAMGQIPDMFGDYQIYIGLKVSKVRYLTDTQESYPGNDEYVECNGASYGTLCGDVSSNRTFGHDYDSENGLDYSLEIAGPYSFFGTSSFGYQFVLELSQISYEATMQGDSRGASFLTDVFGSESSREQYIFENTKGSMEGFYLSLTPVFFYSIVKTDKQLLKFGFGLGLGYLDIEGGWRNGYYKTNMAQTDESEIHTNTPNNVEFDEAGLGWTLRIDLEYSIYSVRFAAGLGTFTMFDSGDVIDQIKRDETYVGIKFVQYL